MKLTKFLENFCKALPRYIHRQAWC